MENGVVDSISDRQDQLPFNSEDSFTDVVLLVQGQQLFTNRSLLAFASPVFSCMFTDDFREKKEKVLTLPDKDHATVSEMLSFLHPGVEYHLTIDSALRLLPIAEEYQIAVLKAKGEEVLLEEIQKMTAPSDDFLLKCIGIAEKCSLPKLLDACVELFSESLQSLAAIKTSSAVSVKTKLKIYEARIACLESDSTETEAWKQRFASVKTRLKEIILPHDEHCRCRTEIKLRSTLQRTCSYCTRNWCSDNISTDAYRSSYWFFCNHKIGYHLTHDATIRNFIESEES